MKVIFSVVKQLKQLQRKPRKEFEALTEIQNVFVFFGLSLQLLKLLRNCEDHFHLYSLSAVHIYDLLYIVHTSFSNLCNIFSQRPHSVTNPKQEIDSFQDCMYPELVDCNLPVEQVLPSLSTSWSRGLGHVVHAQNIRTVGNLSALKDHQVRNLPIKSPKVETLKRVLRNFHQTRQKVKSLKDKVAPLALTGSLSDEEKTGKSLTL